MTVFHRKVIGVKLGTLIKTGAVSEIDKTISRDNLYNIKPFKSLHSEKAFEY